MPLTLVLGPANSAKAGEVLGAYALASQRDALLVVPTSLDAAHYDRELAGEGVTLGRALTFPLLIEEIARRSRFAGARATSLQRERLLHRAIRSLSLPSLEPSSAAPGFTRAAGRLIAAVAQAHASAARFAAALSAWAQTHPERRQFARDLAAIHLRYTEELGRVGLLDAESFAWGALDQLRRHPDRWQATPVYLYGFDDLTEVELDAVRTLAEPVGAGVTVSLTYEPGRDALAARARVVEELRSLATRVVDLPPLDEYYHPGSRTALHHLERRLFDPAAETVDPGDAVLLLEAGGERAEADQVAEVVAGAIADGLDPAEVVVVCRSLGRSGGLLERALARRGLASASARTLPVAHTALGRALIALLMCATGPDEASLERVFEYLRAPGIAADPAAVDALEARCRREGIVRMRDVPRRLLASAGFPLSLLDRLRGAGDHAAAIAELVAELLVAPHAGSGRTLDAGEELDARAAVRVLEALTQVRGIDESAEQLLELISSLELSAAPSDHERTVLVAEPLAIRARRFRWVIVAGLCEGEFPAGQGADDPFLGEDGRRELAVASGLVLPGDPEAIARERYLLYAALSRATERVLVSYRNSDEDGNQVVPSPFIDDLEQLFGSAWRGRRRRRLLSDFDLPAGSERARPAPVELTRRLGSAALAHVRHTRVVSGNALESYAACPVRWLVEAQLNPRDLLPEPESLAKGSFMHSVLERVFASLDGPITPASLPRAEQALEAELDAPRVDFAPGRRGAVRAAVLRGIEADLRRYLRDEAAHGNGWTPQGLELRFGMGGEGEHPRLILGGDGDGDGDGDGGTVALRGVIDRIDVDPNNPRRAIVRDYKSGRQQTQWSAAGWLEGGKLQVGLYMLAVRRLLALEPVGGFYHPLSGPDLRPRGVFETGTDVGDRTYNDARSPTDLDELLDEIEQEALALVGRLRSGELTPAPETCSSGFGAGCRHPGICWAES